MKMGGLFEQRTRFITRRFFKNIKYYEYIWKNVDSHGGAGRSDLHIWGLPAPLLPTLFTDDHIAIRLSYWLTRSFYKCQDEL